MALRNVLGQEKAVNILTGALAGGRTPSAYLFAGESGIGKKFTAINFAKTLNCKNTADMHDCCDECPSCKKIDNRTHPDFLMISPEKGEIRVEEIRAIEEALSFAPYEGERKVVIVDDAETMNQSAANAFLKTLEEPPARSMIILISPSPDRMPETIRSRCSRINFLPLSPENCKEVIKAANGQQRTDSSLSTVSRLSMGRPGLAIADDLLEERDWFLRLFKELVAGGTKESWTDKEEIEKWFDNALVILRDIAVFKITGNRDMLINADLVDNIAVLSKTLEIKDIINSYFRISLLKGNLVFNLNKSITWNYTRLIFNKFTRLA